MSLFRHDRRLGQNFRARVAGVPGGSGMARVAAMALSPAFHFAVGAALMRPGSRAVGVRMLAAGAGAALVARELRDRIGRPRPGDREDGGFPSRHAAAATAITLTAAGRRPLTALLLAAIGAVGLLGRIGSGQHEPADIAAGALLGALSAYIVAAPVRFVSRGLGIR